MAGELTCDEELVRRLPLPLAQLYRRACTPASVLEGHLAAFYLWEAGLKLLASVAVVEYAAGESREPEVVDRLKNLARPSLGHWREFVRLLVPRLAAAGDPHFGKWRDLLEGPPRDDLESAPGLDALLRQELEGKAGSRSRVSLAEFFDRLVAYRNRHIGHGAAGMGDDAFYARAGNALCLAAAEVFGRFDLLAGRRLAYVAQVKQVGGSWQVQRLELVGEHGRRLPEQELPREAVGRLPDGERVYLEGEAGTRPLHPLLLYDAEAREALFLSARRGRKGAEYLCYTNNRTDDRPDLRGEQCRLLAEVLGLATVAPAEAAAWAEQARADDPEPPQAAGPACLGEYELLSELGRGGMGIVYRARQPVLRRQVAVKEMLRRGDARDWARQQARFRREVRALGRVQHPHLVGIYTEGKEADRWFYVMELVEGAPLSRVCEQLRDSAGGPGAVTLGTWQAAVSTACARCREAEVPLGGAAAEPAPAPPESPAAVELPADARGYVRHVVGLLRQVAQAAHALHEAGIVHRDVKPDNIQVRTGGTDAVLMDLGVAQWAEGDTEKLTTARDIPGTLRYASPEQVLARGLVDRRSDVYALGATLWEVLTLQPLYDAPGKSDPELIRSIQFDDPGPVRAHNPAVPPDLEAVVGKCLEKDARQRYATARELADDLGRWLAGEPVRARPVGRLGRGLRWVRRRPALAALLLLTLVALLSLVGVGVGGFYGVRLKDLNGRLEAALAQAQQERDEAGRQRDEASRLRGIAEDQARLVRRLQYVADMNLAQRAMQGANTPSALRLLSKYREPDPGQEDLRHFEWHYLWRLCHRELAGRKWPTDQITGLAFSPDGRWVAGGGADGSVRVQDVLSGRAALDLAVGGGEVPGVALSPDGRSLATGGEGGLVTVWELPSGRKEFTLPLAPHGSSVNCLAYSPDGTQLAAASRGVVVVWDLSRGKNARALHLRPHSCDSVCFHPDGRSLAVAAGDTVQILEVATGRELLHFTADPRINGLCFDRDGKHLAAGVGLSVKIWDATTGKEVTSLEGHTDEVLAVAYSADGQLLASGGIDRTVRVWQARTGQLLTALPAHRGRVLGVAFTTDLACLVCVASWVGGHPSEVTVWDAVAGEEAMALRGHTQRVNGVAFSRDGEHIASAAEDSTVRLWDARTGEEAVKLQLPPSIASSAALAFSPDGRRIAGGSGQGSILLWDARTGQQSLRLAEQAGKIYCLSCSPDGKRLASGDSNGILQVWDLDSGKRIATMQGHGSVQAVAFSPDGCWVAGGVGGFVEGGGELCVWDARTGRERFARKRQSRGVNAVAFSPDGKMLFSGGSDWVVRVWDAATGQGLRALQGHTAPVWAVALSADGRRLASTGFDRTIKLWDVDTGQETLTLQGHTEFVYGVAFSPDGGRLATVGEDRTVRVWETDPPTLDLLAARGLVAHRQEASAAERERRWAEAVFHLTRLLALEPDTASLYDRRGAAFAEQDQWPRAIDDFSRAFGLKEDAWFGHHHALALLAAGDADGYQRACASLLEKFAKTTDPRAADAVAYLAVLVPDRVPDEAAVLSLAARAAAARPSSPDYREALGAAHFRAGNFRTASGQLEQAVAREGNGGTVTMQLFLAMAHHRLGQTDPARAPAFAAARAVGLLGSPAGHGRLLAATTVHAETPQAREWLRRAVARIKEPSSPPSWDVRLRWRLLRQEAEKLLGPEEP
jgi:WD40 repeat protein/serine/threonine protein kinase/tetratricopeptide (TPR) repeat protein